MPECRGGCRLSRRDVIKGMAVGAGVAAFGSWPLWSGAGAATAARDLTFVFAYFRGGWDLLLGLDPRDPRRFHDGNAAVTGIRPGYDRIPEIGARVQPVHTLSGLSLGPAAAPLAAYADRLRVVRGLDMRTLVHGAGRRRFLTGRRAPAARGGASVTGRLAVAAARRPRSQMLIGLEPAELGLNGDEPAGTLQTVRSAVDLPTTIRLTPGEAGGLDSGDASARAAVAVRAITSGTSRVVTVEVASGLDTHGADGHGDHARRLEEGFSTVAGMAGELARTARPSGSGRSWLDDTVIIGFSELGRSPLFNAHGGRDHHVANACFLLGGPLTGAPALGATSDRGMLPVPVDLATGRPHSGGRLLRPEHVLQALLDAQGCDRGAGLGVPPLEALFA